MFVVKGTKIADIPASLKTLASKAKTDVVARSQFQKLYKSIQLRATQQVKPFGFIGSSELEVILPEGGIVGSTGIVTNTFLPGVSKATPIYQLFIPSASDIAKSALKSTRSFGTKGITQATNQFVKSIPKLVSRATPKIYATSRLFSELGVGAISSIPITSKVTHTSSVFFTASLPKSSASTDAGFLNTAPLISRATSSNSFFGNFISSLPKSSVSKDNSYFNLNTVTTSYAGTPKRKPSGSIIKDPIITPSTKITLYRDDSTDSKFYSAPSYNRPIIIPRVPPRPPISDPSNDPPTRPILKHYTRAKTVAIKKYPVLSNSEYKQKNIKTKGVFGIKIKSDGKWATISTPKKLNYYAAHNRAMTIVDKYKERSYKLFKSSGNADVVRKTMPKLSSQFYRQSKSNNPTLTDTYIEKSKYAIDTPGELKGITYKGLQAIAKKKTKNKRQFI
jgi:hypothetical protein